MIRDFGRYGLFLFIGSFFLFACTKKPIRKSPQSAGTPQGVGDTVDTSVISEAIFNPIVLYSVENNTFIKRRTYKLEDTTLVRIQLDEQKHKDMWRYLQQLIPVYALSYISEFEISSSKDGVLGYVTPAHTDNLGKWRLALSAEIAKDLDKLTVFSLYSLVAFHELGHILTLNNTQMNLGRTQASCTTFFTDNICAKEDAYIHQYYDQFWMDIIDDFSQLNQKEFYDKYRDRFISFYASTSIEEDMAEVFSRYIWSTSPTTDKVAMKNDFFAKKTYFDQLRKDIYTNTSEVLALKQSAKFLRPIEPIIYGKQGRLFWIKKQ